MTVKLSIKDQQYVRKKLAGGEYRSASEIVSHALKVLRRVEKMLPSAEDDLRREIDAGLRDIEAGRVTEWDLNAIKRDLLAKLRKAS